MALKNCRFHGIYTSQSGCPDCRYAEYQKSKLNEQQERSSEKGADSSIFDSFDVEGFFAWLGMAIGALAGVILGLVEGFQTGDFISALATGIIGGALAGALLGAIIGALLPLLILGLLVYVVLLLFGIK
jgi:hypothetical protein